MATLGTRYITFRDINSGRKPDGMVDTEVVEIMAQENPVLQDVPWKMCNKGREDITTIRTGMPDATVRAFYEGWKGTKSSKRQVANACCRVTTGIEFDWSLYQADKDKAAFLADEQRAHAESIGNKVASMLFYGDVKDDPKGINGFAKTFSEYGAITGSTMLTDDRKAAFYCLNGGGSGDNAVLQSLFLVGWGAKSAHGIYPEATTAGISIDPLIEQVMPQSDGTNLKMGLQEINWWAGLNIRDFRYCGRVCNIDVTLDPAAAGTTDYTKLVRKLVTRVKASGVTQRFYTSRLVFEAIAEQFEKKTQVNAIKYADLAQKMPSMLLGVPVELCDCLNGDETAVSAAS